MEVLSHGALPDIRWLGQLRFCVRISYAPVLKLPVASPPLFPGKEVVGCLPGAYSRVWLLTQPLSWKPTNTGRVARWSPHGHIWSCLTVWIADTCQSIRRRGAGSVAQAGKANRGDQERKPQVCLARDVCSVRVATIPRMLAPTKSIG